MSEDEYLPPPGTHLVLSAGVSGGIAGLLIGCTLLLSACVLMVFNVLLFGRGVRGIPRELAIPGGLIGVVGVTILGVLALVIGVSSWSTANRQKEPNTLGFAATAASLVGLIAWIIAAIDLMMILLS